MKIRTSRKGRKCRCHGCKHILSIYNHEAYCHIHMYMTGEKKDR